MRRRVVGGLVTAVAIAAVVLVAACAAVYGEAPEVADAAETAADSVAPAAPQVPGEDGGATDASTRPDAAPSPPPACVAPLKPNDSACTQGSQCCSSRCNEEKKCRDACEPLDKTCGFPSTDECCVGLYCGAQGNCSACIASGGTAARTPVTNAVMPQSCCSRSASASTCN